MCVSGRRRQRLLRRGAVRALARLARDLAEALSARSRLCIVVGLLLSPRYEHVDRLHDEEEHGRGDGDEGDQVVDEVAVREAAFVDREGQRGEVMLARDQSDDGREQVAYEWRKS